MLDPQKLEQTTKLQQNASNPQNCVFVCASAGSGKTKILTDRVLRLLLNGISPNKILCLTFTKVAAFEMQHRIHKELSNWSILKEEELQQKIFNLTGINYAKTQILQARTLFNIILDDFEGIKINTIHSFCQNLMTKFPIESDIKPNFQIIDSQTEYNLLLEAKNKLLEAALTDKILAQKIELISANLNEQSFLEIIFELINKRTDLEITKDNFVNLENLNQFIFKILNIEDLNPDLVEELTKNPQKDPDFKQSDLENLANLAKNNEKSKDPQKGELILNYIKNPNNEAFNDYLSVFLTKKDEPQKRVLTKKTLDSLENSSEIIKKEQNRLLDLIEKLNSFHIANLTTNLLEIADEMLSIYANLKGKNNYLDYNDLITKTSKLLTNTANSDWIKYKLDGAIEHILVDESQDTNNNQWKIIKAISEDFFANQNEESEKKTIFVVGDDKQSIFNFQGAQPKIFGEALKYYQNQLQLINDNIHNISLNNSFRSLKNILKLVDDSFKDPQYKKAISPINLVNHSPIRTKGSGKVELWPIININNDKKAQKDDFSWKLSFDPEETHNSKEILAKIIAKKIKSWIKNKRILKSQNRPILAKDIMILLKNRTNNLGNLIVKNLQKEGIAVSGSDRIELVKNIIVQDFIALAKFLLFKEDDLNLAILLKSPLIGISEKLLFELCEEKNNKQISLYTALRNSQATLLKKQFIFLEEIREYYAQNSNQIYQLFLHILEVKDKKLAIINHFGKESKKIINQFLTLCLNFEENELSSLENFVTSLENFNLNVKLDINNDFDEVKITTIHSSKGLEANIVILADCAHDNKAKYGANNDKIIWLNRDDFKIPFWPAGKNNNLTKAIRENDKQVQYDEYLRLLYVAMTRAKDELYISGFGKNIADDCWYNIIKNGGFIGAKSQESGFKELLNLPDQDFLEDDRIFIIEDENEEEILEKSEEKSTKIQFEIPDFLNQKVKIERTQNIIYPSKLDKNSQNNTVNVKDEQINVSKQYNIGSIIHKILEIFSNKTPDKKELIEKYLENHHNYIKNEEKIKILRQTSNIFNNNKFNFLFEENSESEVPIMANLDGQIISGKIDKLIIKDNEILIIDYKSDKIKAEEIREKALKYQNQLNLYSKIIAKIYPNKKISSHIIWTYLGEMLEIIKK